MFLISGVSVQMIDGIDLRAGYFGILIGVGDGGQRVEFDAALVGAVNDKVLSADCAGIDGDMSKTVIGA